ncbi:ABC transporter permease [Marinobacter salinus]|uniref:ABC transporter permease n=1 Tax=Marinobacter salinus TaxID=1874317 RepID=A0A1D9GNH4_9GAMM|nr:ABC transporter permease [Marinobacter salinus]AOY89192.1 ABC transporter permease [Marinobacter salinus]
MTFLPALFSHYRRHPLQLLALAVMIVVATMLWTGVSHLTDQARASLGQSERAVAERRQIERTDGQKLTVQDFVRLRRDGLCVMPWLEVVRPAPAGRVIGIDPLAAACFGNTGEGVSPGRQPLDGKPFLDISEAADLADSGQDARSVLSLLVSDRTDPSALPTGYRETAFSLGPDTGELGDSFLLNLDALGVLVLLITALLLRSVHQLGMAQRRDSFALLHRYGVPRPLLNRLLVFEIVLLALLCVVPGVWLGRLLARVLGSSFGQALEGLFDIPLYTGQGENWLIPVLTMMAVVVFVCLADILKLPARASLMLSVGRVRLLALVALLAGLALALFADSLVLVFLAVALVFMGAGILSPRAIAGFARWQAGRQQDPLKRWRYSELGVLARRLMLPVVALQFALAMVLAVQALVTVFEETFDQWLSQRLAADYYIEVPAGADAQPAVEWLQAHTVLSETGEWHRVLRGDARIIEKTGDYEQSVDVLAIAPVGPLLTDWALQSAADNAWQALAGGMGVMVNEQLARRRALAVGDTVLLVVAGEELSLSVLGVYPDYGRPAGEVLLNAARLPASFEPSFESFSISPGRASIDTLRVGLKQVWNTEQVTVRDNKRVRALADAVFDQTFLLTRAITFLTLVLAAAALLIMGWVFFSTRVWYFRLLAVWGLRRRELAGQLVKLAVALTVGTAALALPLGIWLTWVLVHRINPLAFGWSLPMAVYPEFWLELGMLSLGIGLSIAALMGRQLRRPTTIPTSASGLAGGER